MWPFPGLNWYIGYDHFKFCCDIVSPHSFEQYKYKCVCLENLSVLTPHIKIGVYSHHESDWLFIYSYLQFLKELIAFVGALKDLEIPDSVMNTIFPTLQLTPTLQEIFLAILRTGSEFVQMCHILSAMVICMAMHLNSSLFRQQKQVWTYHSVLLYNSRSRYEHIYSVLL